MRSIVAVACAKTSIRLEGLRGARFATFQCQQNYTVNSRPLRDQCTSFLSRKHTTCHQTGVFHILEEELALHCYSALVSVMQIESSVESAFRHIEIIRQLVLNTE